MPARVLSIFFRAAWCACQRKRARREFHGSPPLLTYQLRLAECSLCALNGYLLRCLCSRVRGKIASGELQVQFTSQTSRKTQMASLCWSSSRRPAALPCSAKLPQTLADTMTAHLQHYNRVHQALASSSVGVHGWDLCELSFAMNAWLNIWQQQALALLSDFRQRQRIASLFRGQIKKRARSGRLDNPSQWSHLSCRSILACCCYPC